MYKSTNIQGTAKNLSSNRTQPCMIWLAIGNQTTRNGLPLYFEKIFWICQRIISVTILFFITWLHLGQLLKQLHNLILVFYLYHRNTSSPRFVKGFNDLHVIIREFKIKNLHSKIHKNVRNTGHRCIKCMAGYELSEL